MRILVAAQLARLDRTSEGICTSKFLVALRRIGHDVTCLLRESLDEHTTCSAELPWLRDIEVVPLEMTGTHSPLCRVVRVMNLHSSEIAVLCGNKIDAAYSYMTGFPRSTWTETSAWKKHLLKAVQVVKPDLIVARAAGHHFETHFALADAKLPVPWVANYHDPFPLSLYPIPYRTQYPIISRKQEAIHARVLSAATALTFPSVRLRDWVTCGDPKLLSKSVIMPHLGSTLSITSDKVDLKSMLVEHGFNLVHAGTLLGPRNPSALFEALERFLGTDVKKMQRARLILIGRVNHSHLAKPFWAKAMQNKNLMLIDARVDYGQALAISAEATASVILEGASDISPFFPAKLADAIAQGKPVLALTPATSVTRDLLGYSYPLLAQPDSVQEIAVALERLWRFWEEERLSELIPNQRLKHDLSEDAFEDAFDRLQTLTSASRGFVSVAGLGS